ncbi:MAG: serine protease MucD [Armatimonadota bacterium]|nr:MAG: serine protease MucD [Armatimonadota bacterium]
MRSIAIVSSLLLFALSTNAQSVLESLEREVTALARKVQPAIVSVEGGALVTPGSAPPSLWTRPSNEAARRVYEALRMLNLPNPVTRKGSGFVVDSSGWVLTGADVVRGAEQCIVRLADGRRLTGKVASIDEATNVALVKVETQGLPVLPMGDSDKLEPGSIVLCVGTQGGYDRSVALCVVAGKERIGVIGQQQFLSNLLQIAGSIGAGSSGAAVVNTRGEVVGIVIATLTPGFTIRVPEPAASPRSGAVPSVAPPIETPLLGASGGGLAVPINDVRAVLAEMQTGRVRRAFLGIVPADRDGAEGAEVVRVIPDSPAIRAGIRLGDVILAINGQPIHRAADISARLRRMKPGDKIQIDILRGAQRLRITVPLGERANTPP